MYILFFLMLLSSNDSLESLKIDNPVHKYTTKQLKWLKAVDNIILANDSVLISYDNNNCEIFLTTLNKKGEIIYDKKLRSGRNDSEGGLLDISDIAIADNKIYITDRIRRVLQVLDISGKFIKEEKINSKKGELFLSSIKSGIAIQYEDYKSNNFIHLYSIEKGFYKSFYSISEDSSEINYLTHRGRLLNYNNYLIYFGLFNNKMIVFDLDNLSVIEQKQILKNVNTKLEFNYDLRDFENKPMLINAMPTSGDIGIIGKNFIFNGFSYSINGYRKVHIYKINEDKINFFKMYNFTRYGEIAYVKLLGSSYGLELVYVDSIFKKNNTIKTVKELYLIDLNKQLN